MNQPKFTVLMSVLNGEAYLREAMDSVFAQTFADFEFLIIDNASTDGTPDILAACKDDRLRIIRNDQVLTLTQSLNKGLAAAQGEYVARLDADDIAMPERLARQAAFLDANPDVALVASACYEFGDGAPFPGRTGPQPPQQHDALVTELARNSLIAHSSIAFRRQAALDIGSYAADFTYCMDYILYFRLAQNHRLACLPDPLVAIRSHAGQITSLATWRFRREQEAAAAFVEILGYPKLSDMARRNLRRYLALTTLRLTALSLRHLQPVRALSWAWRAVTKAPDQILPALGDILRNRLSSR